VNSTPLDPERGIKVTMLLADYAMAAEGKLTIVGGGWNVTGPQPIPFAIAMLVEVPWSLTNRQHEFRLELIDLDGNAVLGAQPDGTEAPVLIEGHFELGRPPGVRAGTALPFPLAINHGPLPLAPAGQYEWRLMINGEAHEDWRLAFSTRPEVQSQAA